MPIFSRDVHAAGDTMTGPLRLIQPVDGNKVWLAKYDAGTGHSNAPTAPGAACNYLHIGGREYGNNGYSGIGFGYVSAPTDQPAVQIGHIETATAGNTSGDFFVATRNATTNTAPTVQFRIKADGQLQATQAGVVGTPAFSWASDPTTGMYASAPGHVAFACAGTLRLEVDAAGLIVPNGIRFGTAQSTNPGLFWQGERVLVQRADQSADAEISMSVAVTRPMTVAELPAPTAFYAGARAFVSDSGVQYLGANISMPVTGGGSNLTPVYCDGVNWRVG